MHKPASRTERLLEKRATMLSRGVLMLAMEEIQDSELREILRSPLVPALELLDVQENKLTASAVQWLVQEPKLRSLRHLALSGNPVGDAGVQALAAAPFCHELTELFLARTGLGQEGARALGGCLRPGRIRFVDAGLQPLSAAASEALAALPTERLRLQGIGLDGATAQKILQGAACRELDLQDNPLGPGALAGLPSLSSGLKLIDLSNTGLSAIDAAALARLSTSNLHTLILSHCPLGDAGVTALSGAPWLGQLKVLSVVGSKASPVAFQALRGAYGARDGLVL